MQEKPQFCNLYYLNCGLKSVGNPCDNAICNRGDCSCYQGVTVAVTRGEDSVGSRGPLALNKQPQNRKDLVNIESAC